MPNPAEREAHSAILAALRHLRRAERAAESLRDLGLHDDVQMAEVELQRMAHSIMSAKGYRQVGPPRLPI